MRAKMILAEAATGHPDGTISMLRAGITHVWVQSPPYGLQASLVSRIEAEMGDTGTHPFDLRCMNDDGAEVMPKMQGNFTVPQGGGVNNLILNFQTAFPKPGRYTFVLRVDNVQLDGCSLLVSQAPAPGSGAGPPANPPAEA